jgi:predicted  nucleic acid-binding Zn-ribbon protein
MNKSVQTLLRLEGLVLTRKALELAGNKITNGSFEVLGEEIEKLRRQLPPPVLSLYDRLARRYHDPVSMLIEGVCEGCRQKVSKLLAVLNDRSHKVLQCEHCGRLIFPRKHAPDYVM